MRNGRPEIASTLNTLQSDAFISDTSQCTVTPKMKSKNMEKVPLSDACSHRRVLAAKPFNTSTAMATFDISEVCVSPVDQTTSEDVELTYSMLVKEEIRQKIKNRRSSKGLPDVNIDTEPSKTDQLTAEDVQRRQLRRQKNRIAAARCRQKKKLEVLTTVQEEKLELERNKQLKEEIEKLSNERDWLERFLREHKADEHCKLNGEHKDNSFT
ncbi:uncharacterized protein LOC144449748 [Glandiceps talaboti]